MDCFRGFAPAFAGSSPLFALITPPSLTRLLAKSALARYAWKASPRGCPCKHPPFRRRR